MTMMLELPDYDLAKTDAENKQAYLGARDLYVKWRNEFAALYEGRCGEKLFERKAEIPRPNGRPVKNRDRDEEMADLRDAGWSYNRLAAKYGISPTAVVKALQRQQAREAGAVCGGTKGGRS